jgi:uncharacterized protein involved in exopolysaccharide biosynthesis
VLYRRRYLVLAVLAAVAGFATVRSLLTTPVYRAAAQIVIERENYNILDFKGVADLDSARDDYYQTQYRLLQSRALARRVIEDLDLLNDPEYGGPRTAVETEAAKAAPPGSSSLMEGAIDAVLARVTVAPIRNSRLVTLAYESGRAKRRPGRQPNGPFSWQTLIRSRLPEANEWLRGQAEEHVEIAQAETCCNAGGAGPGEYRRAGVPARAAG